MASPLEEVYTRVEQRAIIKFLTFKKVGPVELHRRLQAFYSEQCVHRSTVNKWALKFRGSNDPNAQICDNPRNGRPLTATDDFHCACVDDLIQGNPQNHATNYSKPYRNIQRTCWLHYKQVELP